MSFGITRAKNNGFYETKATIKDENLEKVKLNLNFNEIKDVATDIFDGEGVNVTQLANTVANTMSSFNMEANGVKASWTDSMVNIAPIHSMVLLLLLSSLCLSPLERISTIKQFLDMNV